MFDEGNGDVAKGGGELGANPSPPDLLVSVIACPENAGVECICYNGCDVCSVSGALCGVASVVPADVGVVKGLPVALVSTVRVWVSFWRCPGGAVELS